MEERYPYVRFVIDAAPLLAGVVGLVVLLSGTVRSCHHGGGVGVVGFFVALVTACVAYVGVMVTIELLRIAVDIERGVRQAANTSRPSAAPPEAGA